MFTCFTLRIVLIGGLYLAPAMTGAHIVPVSTIQNAQANASLVWSDGSPPSTATNSETLNTFGSLNVQANADNFGITSVAALGAGISTITPEADGFALLAAGTVLGHSNLAAFASAAYSSDATLVFSMATTMDVTLSLTFTNGVSNDGGTGGGQSSMQLLGPGGALLFEYIHTSMGLYEDSSTLRLVPGEYSLRVDSMSSMEFATGLEDNGFVSGAIVHITVPGPGGLTALILVALQPRRRRRRDV